MFLLAFHTINGVCHRTLSDRVGEDALLLLTIVKSERRADMEVFQGIDVDISVSEQTPVGIAVVRITVETCQRVLTVRIATYRTGIVAVGRADGQ